MNPVSKDAVRRADAEPSRPVRVFVLSRRGQDIEQVRRAFENGVEPEPAPYGFNYAERSGWSVRYSRDRPKTRTSKAFFDRFEFDFFHAINNLGEIRRADVVWTMLEWEWLAVALLQRLRLAPRRPVIANSVWLSEKWWGHPRPKRAFLRRLLLPHFTMTLHSRRGLQRLHEALPRVNWRISKFGISARAFPLTPPRASHQPGAPIKIYSIGNDGTRDWETLLEAFGNDARFEITIVCRWLDRELTTRYHNLRMPTAVTIAEQRQEYLRADVVAMPMWPNTYSGITVVLEAVATGRPVVCAATGGVDTYFDENEVLFVPPVDATALREAVLACADEEWLSRAERAQKRFVEGGYTAEAMIDRYMEATWAALGR